MAQNPLFGVKTDLVGAYQGNDIPRHCKAAGTITSGNLCIINGRYGVSVLPTAIRASSAAAATAYGKLGVALNDAVSGGDVYVCDWMHIVNVDTSAWGAIGDPVYLAPAGAVAATPGAFVAIVGRITRVSATLGAYLLDSTLSTIAGVSSLGTDNVSWSVNLDATVANEDPFLRLMGGGGAATYYTDLIQDSSTPDITLRLYNATGAAYVSPTLHLGRSAETAASIAPNLYLNATSSASVLQSLRLGVTTGATNTFYVVGDAKSAPTIVGAALSIGTGAHTSTVASYATGALDLYTGSTTETGAAGNGLSGAINLHSGNTSQSAAGGAAAASGAVSMYSGATTNAGIGAAASSGIVKVGSGDVDNTGVGAAADTGATQVYTGNALSTGAGTASGSSGIASLYSGTSADLNTGNVLVYSGNAAGTGGAIVSGNVALSTGTVGGTGTTGNATMATGNATGAGTSGNVAFSTGTVAGVGTTGSITMTTGAPAGAGTSGSITMTTGIPTGGGTRGGLTATVGAMALNYGTGGLTGDILGANTTDLSSGAFRLDTGDADSSTGARVSGNISIFTGTSVAVLNAGGPSGDIDIESGATSNTGAFAPGASGQMIFASGQVTDSQVGVVASNSGQVYVGSGNAIISTGAGGEVGGDSGAVMLLSGDCTVGAGTNESGSSGTVTVGSGTTNQMGAGAGHDSGIVSFGSGNASVGTAAGAATSGASGAVNISSGTTDVSAGANTGGVTGAVSIGSGNALSTFGGATASGSSGNMNVTTGTSADANTGTINVATGVPAAAGTSGNVAIATGATAGAGTSGNITMTTGTTVAGTRGSIIGTCGPLTFNYGTGGTACNILGANVSDVATGAVRIDTGDSTSAAATVASGAIDIISGTSVANGAVATGSGAVTVRSGAIDSISAFAAGISGAWSGGSGNSDVNDGGGSSTGSGNVTLSSGNATSTLSAASGNSGTVALASGTSIDGNSGNITFTTGAAGVTRGTIQAIGRLTTTDAVAAGTARVVGGQTLNEVAASAALANVLTVFSTGTRTIPADTFKVGTNVSFEAMVGITAVSGGGCSVQVEVFLGGVLGTLVFDTTGIAAAGGCVVNGLVILRGSLSCRSAGGGGTLVGFMQYTVGAVNAVLTTGHDVAGSAAGTYTVACNTTIPNTLDVAAVTDAAGTTVELQNFRVWETA